VLIGQRRTVDDIMVALASLELFGEGVGILRYLVSYETGMFEVGYGIPEPELVVRDGSGRELPWSPQGAGCSKSEMDGEVEVRDVPEIGELEVEVARLVSLVFDEETGRRWRKTPTTAPVPSGSLSSAPTSIAGPIFLGALAWFGQDEKQSEYDYQDEAGRDVDEREREGDEVGDHPEHVAPGHGPE
jgi:hypothetical protein